MKSVEMSPRQDSVGVTTGQTQDFQRYEFKYLLNARIREEIENEIKEFMRFDGHVDPNLENMYHVRSLYFDDPSASAFHEKIDGVMIRQKFRIRTYGQEWTEGMPVFLESKGRHNERTYKHRVAISPQHIYKFLKSELTWGLLDIYPEKQLIEHFVFNTHRRNIAPLVLVDYLRRPYICDFDTNFRLTFDYLIKGARSSELFPAQDNAHWISCQPGWTILEVKFDQRVPKWFHRILQSHEMRRLSISKFCLGMESCGIAVDLS